MSARRVVVTGLGLTTPVGGDVASTWSALLAGQSGIGPLTEDWADSVPARIVGRAAVEPSEVLPRVRCRRTDRYEQFALIAAAEAWKDAGFEGKAADAGVDPERFGVAVASGIGGILTTLQQYDTFKEKGWQRVSPFTVPMLMPNGAAGWISIEYDARAGAHTTVSACSSGAEGIGYAIDMIRSGRADIVIAGGSEAAIHPLNLAAFGSMRALSLRNDEPERASRPFDKGRDGFVLGEGAGIVILESEEHARARGARVYAEAAGVGHASDAYDIVQPEPDGRGGAAAMRRALAHADAAAEEIVHVNAHATSTPAGDAIETRAIRSVLGDSVTDRLTVTATKSMTGHLLGGAGALESIITVLSLYHGKAPHTINVDDLDDEVVTDIVRDEPRKLPDGPVAAINNSFGFGGADVALVFRRA